MSNKTIDCITTGSCVLDILATPVNLDEPLNTKLVHKINPMQLCCGGLSCNSGLALAKLGFKTHIFTYVGDDPWGQMIRRMLKEEGVDTSLLLIHDSEPTSTTVVTIDASGQRAFIHCQGAAKRLNLKTCLAHMDTLSQSAFFLVGYYSLMPDLQDDLPRLFAALHDQDVQTVMDAAGDGGGMQPLDMILPHMDIYIPSLVEAKHQTSLRDPQMMIDVYRNAGCKGILGIKLGEQGVLLSGKSGQYLHLPVCELPEGEKVIDTTGAGDTFLAGFIAGRRKGMDMQQAGRLGTAVAACCVTAMGGSTAIKSLEQTMSMIS
ncbi:MAG: carbohydrate kinase family protein [Phycisphaeraceae bacterium JB051]